MVMDRRDKPSRPLRVLSLGAGVQSSTLLLMAVHGELEVDRAIFADTQWEPRAVYDWLGGLILAAGHAGIPVDTVTAGNLRDDALSASRRFAPMPLHVVTDPGGIKRVPIMRATGRTIQNPDDPDEWEDEYEETGEYREVAVPPKAGMIRRQCTKEYKIGPVQRRLRELGADRTSPATLLIGISLDEATRMKPSRVQYVRHEYPLIDMRMTRYGCVQWLERRGYPEPPKSACIACPFMDDTRWRKLRDESPDEWADAVDFDRRVRHMTRINGEVFVHRSLRPLDQVDLTTQRDAGQVGLWDVECDGMCGV